MRFLPPRLQKQKSPPPGMGDGLSNINVYRYLLFAPHRDTINYSLAILCATEYISSAAHTANNTRYTHICSRQPLVSTGKYPVSSYLARRSHRKAFGSRCPDIKTGSKTCLAEVK